MEKQFASQPKNIEIHKELDIKEKIAVPPSDDKVKEITPKWSATKKGKTFKIEDSDSEGSSGYSESDGSSGEEEKPHYIVKETRESIDIDEHQIDDQKQPQVSNKLNNHPQTFQSNQRQD